MSNDTATLLELAKALDHSPWFENREWIQTLGRTGNMDVCFVSDVNRRASNIRKFIVAAQPKNIIPLITAKPECTVLEMKKGDGTSEFYTHIRVGDRTLTPYMSKIRGRAEYEVAEWEWLLNGGPKPRMTDWLERTEGEE